MREKLITWDDWNRMRPEAKAGLALELSQIKPGERGTDNPPPVRMDEAAIVAMASGMPGVANPDLYLTRAEYEARPATPQTRAKLQRDIIGGLLGRGVLDRDHMRVADEMLDLAEAYRLGGGCTWAIERVQSGGNWASPFERQSEATHRIYRLHYRPWLRSLALQPIEQHTGSMVIRYLCAAAFVRLIVQENMPVKAAEKRCGIVVGMGRGACILRIALDRYLTFMGTGEIDQTAETRAFEKAA